MNISRETDSPTRQRLECGALSALSSTAPSQAAGSLAVRGPKASASWLLIIAAWSLFPYPLVAQDGVSAMDLARKLNQAFVEVAERVSPAVVVIEVAHKPDSAPDLGENPFFDLIPELRRRWEEQYKKNHPRGSDREPVYDSEGSGIVMREDGYILTNSHVVDGAEKILIRLQNGTEYEDAQVVGVDPQSDVAVLKVNAKGLPVARLGDSANTKVGEFAIAVGAPFRLDYSVTFGHVSAKGRRVFDSRAMWDQDFIQTDARINPGNSGGPLVNIEGEVIGINTLIRGMNSGIGFAVPINLAREVADQLISEGKYTRAVLGVAISSLAEAKDYKKRVRSITEGVVVTRIYPWAPAAASDLEAGDIVVAVDGKAVATDKELQQEIRRKKVGQPVTLDVVRIDDTRAEKRLKIKVKPGELPENAFTLTPKPRPPEEKQNQGLGIEVQALTEDLAEKLNVQVKEGVLVSQVEADSLADKAGLSPGDIITEVNRRKVTNPDQFKDALKTADTKKGVLLNLVSEAGRRIENLKDSGD